MADQAHVIAMQVSLRDVVDKPRQSISFVRVLPNNFRSYFVNLRPNPFEPLVL